MIVLFTERLGIAPVVGVWGKRHEVPCHPQLEGYLQAWLGATGIARDKKEPLFRSVGKGLAKKPAQIRRGST